MEPKINKNNILTRIVIVGFAIVAVALLGIHFFSGPTEKGTPKFSVSENEYDLGKFNEDQSPSHTFVVHNTGTATLEIVDVDPDCTCTVPKFDKTIRPGGTGNITLSMKPFSLENGFTKGTTVRTNDPANRQLVLTLKGVSEPLVTVQPSHIIRLSGKPTQDIMAQVRIVSNLSFPWKVAYYQTSIPDKIDVAIQPEKAGKVYTVQVKNKLKEKGSYYGKVEIFSNFKERPRLILRIFGDVSAIEGSKS